MVVFPNAKINLGLNILEKRSDGYHNIDSCFYPIELCDVLEIIPSNEVRFTSSGIDIPGNIEDNLCLKAYHLIAQDHAITPVHIHLHKIIPIGAGLGGGSSDASFTLKALNKLFNLNISEEQLEHYASQLGSDCPFFIRNIPVIASGTGTDLDPIELDLGRYSIQVKYPDIHISTQDAYAGISPSSTSKSVEKLLKKPLKEWKGKLKNDFEASIISKYPEIENLKNRFYNDGAIYSSMTGSGSAVYGIFKQS